MADHTEVQLATLNTNIDQVRKVRANFMVNSCSDMCRSDQCLLLKSNFVKYVQYVVYKIQYVVFHMSTSCKKIILYFYTYPVLISLIIKKVHAFQEIRS